VEVCREGKESPKEEPRGYVDVASKPPKTVSVCDIENLMAAGVHKENSL